MADLFLNTKKMKIFKELNKIGYKHYTENTIKELDNLPLDSEERIMEQSLAFRWFREKHDLVHHINRDGGWWLCSILNLYDEKEQGVS